MLYRCSPPSHTHTHTHSNILHELVMYKQFKGPQKLNVDQVSALSR